MRSRVRVSSQQRAAVAAARELVKQELDQLSLSEANSSYGLMLKEKYESLRILESMQTGGFAIAQSAVIPTSPYSPRPLRDGVLALVVGAVLGLGAAFLVERLDRRIKDERTLRELLGMPVLATIPEIRNAGGKSRRLRNGNPKGTRTSLRLQEHPALLESFRVLRTSLQYFNVDKNLKTILVTSGLPQEGKTTTITNLALSLALAGKRVVLLEADLRRPMVHEYLGLKNSVGLSTLLAQRAGLSQVLQMVRTNDMIRSHPEFEKTAREDGTRIQKNLYCLTSGPLPPNPAELLGSAAMRKVLEDLAENADYVLVDTPPLLMVADALILAPYVDAAIVAARLYVSARDEVEQMGELLRQAGVRTLGVVAGGARMRSGYYSRKYGYGYGYGYGRDGREGRGL